MLSTGLPSKVLCSIHNSVSLFDIVTLVRLPHLLKAYFPIFITELGIVIFVRPQP